MSHSSLSLQCQLRSQGLDIVFTNNVHLRPITTSCSALTIQSLHQTCNFKAILVYCQPMYYSEAWQRGQILFKMDPKEVEYEGKDWSNVTQRFASLQPSVYKKTRNFEKSHQPLNKNSASRNWLRILNYRYMKTDSYMKNRPRKCEIFIAIIGSH